MPPYDSDSSGDEELDYTLTNVLLGYASVDPRDDEISQLGGRPVRENKQHHNSARGSIQLLTQFSDMDRPQLSSFSSTCEVQSL